MILMFVRHGEDKNDKLTKLGKIQSKLAAKQRENFKFTKIYCSPLGRCVQTARYFQNKLKLPLEICENLRDREMLNGSPTNEHEQEWYDNYMNPLYSSTNPEGCKEYLTRSFVEFKRIINENFDSNQNVILVAHSCTLYALIAFINGIDKNRNINWVRAGHCNKIYFEIVEKV
ncbi:MAG: histidine phosphatase family protein [Clostridia bacterium]|nr:histidine phosphatase family protein [Clostridia bacterium]